MNLETVMRLTRNNVLANCRLFALIMIVTPGLMYGQALNMDGQSGVFFQPSADVVPAAPNKFNAPTLGVHVVDANGLAIRVTVETNTQCMVVVEADGSVATPAS